MTYYRLTLSGPVRTNGPDWDIAAPRCTGYRFTIDHGPGWKREIVIDRTTRTHYNRLQSTRTTLQEITREEARAAYQTAGRPALRPILH